MFVPQSGNEAYKSDTMWGKYSIYTESFVEVTNETAGGLSRALFNIGVDLGLITNLTVHGTLNADDFTKINSNMTSLLHLDISDTDVTEIPADAFLNKTTLLSVKLPNGLKTIGDNAFSGCTVLGDELVLPETLETIGSKAFYDCKIISGTLLIQANVKSIGTYAFSNCASITVVDMSKAEGLTMLNNYAFHQGLLG